MDVRTALTKGREQSISCSPVVTLDDVNMALTVAVTVGRQSMKKVLAAAKRRCKACNMADRFEVVVALLQLTRYG